jgi:hypothetical protein
MESRARRPPRRPGSRFDPTVPLLILLGGGALAMITGVIIWSTDAADHRLAVTLGATGVTTTAHDARIQKPCGGKGCPPEPSVRATVDLPDGPTELLLRGSDPDTSGLPADAWSPAPVGNRYAGEIAVLFDPEHPHRVMEQADMTSNLLHSDSTIEGNIALTGAAVALAGAIPLAWQNRPASMRRASPRTR